VAFNTLHRATPVKLVVPRALRRLSVQFRGMGIPEQEIVVSGEVKEVDGNKVVTEGVAKQGDTRVIRNAEAEVEL